MCGIVGAVSDRNVVPMLVEGLRRLEYRGYDSSGVGLQQRGGLERVRSVGRVADLAAQLGDTQSAIGLAHTRWATHGAPSVANAHPHQGGERVLLVHNGIIENHQTLRTRLEDAGYVFTSGTDSEAVAHLLDAELAADGDVLAALQRTVAQLHGAFALGVMCSSAPDTLYCARRGSPLVLGLGFNEQFFASDAAALMPLTRRVVYLEDGDIAQLTRSGAQLFDAAGHAVERTVRTLDVQSDAADLGQYRHYMQKEIAEQPEALAATLAPVLAAGFDATLYGSDASALFARARAVRIVACGSSYHAGLVARYWIETLTDLPVAVDIASEYRYSAGREVDDTLLVAISQSGETADLLAAVRAARERGRLTVLALCNVPMSTLTREADLTVLTHAGQEIGVASTKAFTTQLAALFALAGALATARGGDASAHLAELPKLPALTRDTLALEAGLQNWARLIADRAHALFLGRGALYPIALEGALKLKEIAYIHAEGYAAGELKHGPLALVDHQMPVVVLLARDALFEKTLSNLREVEARGGEVFLLAEPGCEEALPYARHHLVVPAAGLLAPVLMTLPLQLLAYHTACAKGTDVDKPRNLAKAVTVE
ncbi:glutamine--fructose-6-phosphate transaminase (isomerizing) [Chitinibacteraceae bacterium HSL-7]